MTIITFGEPLPAECPPAEASDAALSNVHRLIAVTPPSDQCFASKKALGDVPLASYNGTECDWASCSLFVSVEPLLKLKGLRKRYPYIATLTIPAESGRHVTRKQHIDFWRYGSFSLANAVVQVRAHGL